MFREVDDWAEWGKLSKLSQINLWHSSWSYIWVWLWSFSRCHVPMAFISEFDVASFTIGLKESLGLKGFCRGYWWQGWKWTWWFLWQCCYVLKWYCTFAKMKPELPYDVQNYNFPLVPFRGWSHFPVSFMSHKIKGLGRAFPFVSSTQHVFQVALCTSRTMLCTEKSGWIASLWPNGSAMARSICLGSKSKWTDVGSNFKNL